MNTNKNNSRKSYYFSNKLCTKIEFKKTFTLPCNKPKVKCIKTLSIIPYISSSKIVELSMNVDEQLIKSKRLLIEGYLSIQLVYVSCDINEKTYSTDFKNSFHTYIVLDNNTNIDLDKFTIKSNVKNICYKSINCKNLCVTFDLLLLANKIGPLPPEKQLPNSIIVKNSNNEEVAKIDFDATNKVFRVNSSGKIPDNTLGPQKYFTLKLRNIKTQTTIINTQIISNESANNFAFTLNNFNFSFNDNFIELDYLIPQNITITNYPNTGEEHIPDYSKEFYKITPEGLKPYTPPPPINKLPNIIIVDNKNLPATSPITTIEFDSNNQKLLVTSTDFLMANAGSSFSFKVKDRNNQFIKYSSIILEGTDAKNFVNDLNNKTFQYDDILEIDFTPSLSFIVTNFPTRGKIYISDSNKEYFRITPDGLIAYTPTPPPPVIKLPNKIIINSNLGNEAATIEFNSNNNKFIIISTGEIPNVPAGNIPFFSLKLKSIATQSIKEQGIIESNESANSFANNLNNRDFNYTDFLELEYSIPPSIRITNYPTTGTTHIPSITKEYFAITREGLKPYTPPPIPPPPVTNSKVKLYIRNRSFNLEEVASIELNKLTNKFIVTSTGKLITLGEPEYFNFTQLNSFGGTLDNISINNSDNIDKLRSALTNRNFSSSNIISLRYVDKELIKGENINSTTPYTFKSSKALFRIENDELIPFSPTSLQNIIFFENENNNIVGTMSFYTDPKILTFTFTNEIVGPTSPTDDYFTIKLKNSTGFKLFEKTIKGSDTFNKLAIALYNKIFQFRDILELSYKEAGKVTISNYQTQGTIFTAPGNTSSYYITPTGLELIQKPIPPPPPVDKLPNTIILKNNVSTGEKIVLTIEFKKDTKQLLVKSINAVTSDPTPLTLDNVYFSFQLNDSNNNIKFREQLLGKDNGVAFANALNGKNFEYNNIIRLYSASRRQVTITNYPSQGQDYHPTETAELYRITPNGLIPYIPTPPPPTINSKIRLFVINSTSNLEEVATIELNKINNKYVVTAPSRIITLGLTEYFNFTQLNSFGTTLNNISINNSNNISTLTTTLNDRPFSSGNIVSLRYVDKDLIKVENIKSTTPYTLKSSKALFKIENGELAPYSSTSLPNIVTFRNGKNNIIGTISFITNPNILTFTFTTEEASSTFSRDAYFTIKLKNNAGNVKFEETIIGSENFSKLAVSLDNKSFNFGDILELSYKETNKVTISNYQTPGTTFTAPLNDSSYNITPAGLEFIPPTPPPPPPVMNSKIILYIRNSTPDLEEVSSIELDSATNKYVVTSTNKIINIGLPEYFNFTQLNSSGNILNNISINRSNNIDTLRNNLNDQRFASGNIVSLRYVNRDLFKVENIKANPNYTLKDSKDLFKIENGELAPFSSTALPNIITFLSEDGTRVGAISFYTNPKILTVFFTPDRVSSTFPNDNYFTVKLKDNNGAVKFQESITGKENFNKISIALDNKAFNFNDILELSYKQANKVTISNFGSQGRTFTAPGNNSSYIITPTGLQLLQNKLKNTITFNGANNDQISTISFNTDNTTLIVTSSGRTAAPSVGGNKYFATELIDPFSTVKASSSVKGNENANNFKNTLNGKQFEYGYIISLEYADKSKVSISNYPNDGATYTPLKNLEESFFITSTGLVKVNILPNIILVKDTDNSNLFYLLFDTFNKKLIVKDTKKTTRPSTLLKTPYYISIELRDSTGVLQSYGYLKTSGDNSSIMTTALNNKDFDFGYIINLTYIDSTKVFISNTPTATGNPSPFGESFTITPTGLQNNQSVLVNNTIIVKGDNDAEIVDINFAMPGPKLDLNDKGGKVPPQFFNEEYFKLTINRFNTNTKTESSLIFTSPTDTPDDFIDPLQNEDIFYESLITLNYKESNRVQVNNITIPASFARPRVLTESFRVTLDGLKLADNAIKFLDTTNTPVAMLTFDHVDKRVKIWGEKKVVSNNPTFNTQEYFSIEIKDTAGTRVKLSSSVNGNQFASKLESGLNYGKYAYGDILTLKYKENQKISISNYPARGPYVYSPETNVIEESYRISPLGLMPLQSILQNTIIILDGDTILATIMFDKTAKKLITKSTGKTPSGITKTNYFKLVLKDTTNNIIAQTSLQNNANANKVKTDLNDKTFDINYILELTAVPNTVIVTQYPNLSDRFTTSSSLKTIFFKIEANKLAAYTPTPTFLDNVINFRSVNNASDAATIKFDIASNRLNVTSDGSSVERTDKFDFTLKDRNNVEKIKASINSSENGVTFASALTDVSFEIGDKIEIGSRDRSRALIAKLPISPNEYFLPTSTETFTIAADGLKFIAPSALANAQVLPQIITVQGKINSTVTDILATVYLDNNSKQLIAYSTGKTVVSSLTGEYFALVISDTNGNEIKTAAITIGENANKFATDLNGFAFQEDYIITVRINQNA